MNRVWTLSLFLIRDLFRSLAGIVPLAVGLGFGIIAFEYGMDQAQFITVAGIGMSHKSSNVGITSRSRTR